MIHIKREEKVGVVRSCATQFEIQNISFVRYIALDRWVVEHLVQVERGSELISELHAHFGIWASEHEEWSDEVIENSAQFAKKLCQILQAKGIAHQLGRKKEGRALLGVSLRTD